MRLVRPLRETFHVGRPITASRFTERFADRPLAGRWTVGAALSRAMVVWREEGLRSLWFKILGETIYRRAVLMQHSLRPPQQAPTSPVPVEIVGLVDPLVDDFLDLRPDADPNEIRLRLAAGRACFAAVHEGRIVHASWSATGPVWIEYLARELQLAPGEIYSYETFTDPAFRGRNIATLRSAHETRLFHDAGYRRTLAIVVPENKSALRQMEKAGYRRIGVMGYVKLGRRRWNFCRVERGADPPGVAQASASANWDAACEHFASTPHYLNQFLGELKRSAHLHLIDRWGGLPPNGRILKTDLFEEAVGPDGFLPSLADEGRHVVVGMDVSVAVSSKAHARDADRPLPCVAADSRCLPFPKESFALIVSPSTLDHFPDDRDLGVSLRELARVLQPGGRLIITLDNRQNIFDPLLRLANRLHLVPYYLGRSYRVNEVRDELKAAGFVVEDTTAILHNPRLTAVAAVAFAAKLNWPPLTRGVESAVRAAQSLERTPLCYFTGCFVAAKAVKPFC